MTKYGHLRRRDEKQVIKSVINMNVDVRNRTQKETDGLEDGCDEIK